VERGDDGLTAVEQRQDVGVLEACGGGDLPQKALGPEHGGELRPEDLERDLSLVLQVLGQVDRGHAALTELMLDAVAALEGRVQAGDGRRLHAAKMRNGSENREPRPPKPCQKLRRRWPTPTDATDAETQCFQRWPTLADASGALVGQVP
jgi:hypothetical protein